MEESQMTGFFNKLLFGLGMIAIGVLYLLNQLNVLTFNLGDFFSTFWPVFIIYFGLRGLIIRNKYKWGGSFIWSLFLIFLGVYFLLNNLGVAAFNYDNMYKFIVPVLLILFGLNVLFKGSGSNASAQEWKAGLRSERQARKEGRRAAKEEMRERYRAMKEQRRNGYEAPSYIPPVPPVFPPDEPIEAAPGQSKTFTDEAYQKADRDWKWKNYSHGHHGDPAQSGKVNRSSFIGDIYYGQDYWDLTPLDISLFIGDTVIDLTKANIPSGETRINVSSFIGDLKIFVPNDMQLEISVTASAFISDMKVLDRYESGLFKNLQTQTRDYADGDKKIRIIVSTFIGDVIVKRVG
jgi:lia operon protein LiaF